MPRPFSIALIASLCLTFIARAEDKPSPAVKRILDKAVGKVRTNRTEFDKANKEPLETARDELQGLLEKLVDEKKDKEAKAVLEQITSLEADVLKMAKAPEPLPGGGGKVPPQKPLLERMAGKWDRINNPAHYRLHGNGTAECVTDDGQKQISQGRVTAVAPEVVEINWSTGHRDMFYLAGEDVIAVRQWDPTGKRDDFALERMPSGAP